MKLTILNKISVFYLLFLAGCLIRLLLTLLPSFHIDIGSYQAWSARLVEIGSINFYAPGYFADYFPGYLYMLWGLGAMAKLFSINIFSLQFEIILKVFASFFEFLTAFLIYKILFKHSKSWASFGSLLYLLNPATIFNTSIWGQVDGIATFFLVLSFYLFLEKNQVIPWSITTALAILIKPQTLIPLPTLLTQLTLKSKKNVIALGLLIFLPIILAIPFFTKNPIFGLFNLFQQSTAVYPYTSLFAFNFWGVNGFWKPDSSIFLGLSLQTWGTIIFLLFYFLTLLPLILKKETNPFVLFLSASLLILVFFLFPTRIHERYLFPFFSLFVIAATLKKSLPLIFTYILLSVIHFINLWYVYYYYNVTFNNPNYQGNLVFESVQQLIPFFSIISIATFVVLFIYYYQMSLPNNFLKNILNKFIKGPITYKKILIGILVLTAFLRFFRLDYPNTYIFDEVYHAFTAQEMLKGHPQAWEWWNTPPKGFAYEWTHPPLAKEAMVVSMFLLQSTDPWAWRFIGAVFGVFSVFLVYKLGSMLFKDQSVGLLSAFIFSLDGLNFVQSRTGMNDIYFVSFLLLSLIFFLKKKLFYSALFLGLAVSSKWAAIYLVGLYIILIIRYRYFKNIFWFFIIPPLVYLISYIPFFLAGHSIDQFIELQKQMWWYHTNLKATHDYSSPWWSWPFNLYPVWYYVDYYKNFIANIFASGNPLMFWFGFAAIILCAVEVIRKRVEPLVIIVLGYLVFILPWSLSPRIMFLYHYSPCVPFLALALGYQLSKLKNRSKEEKKLFYLILGLIILSFLFVYPFITGVFLPREIMMLFFETNFTKNPFAG